MPPIRVKKIPGLTAPYWDLSEYFLSLDGDQTLTPEQVAAIIASLGLGTLATQNEGTGAGDFRDNAANDARFVQLSGNQTITGAKEFTGGLKIASPTVGNSRMLLQRGGGDELYIAAGPAEQIFLGNQTDNQIWATLTSAGATFVGALQSGGGTGSSQHRTNSQNDARYVQLTGDQNIGGVKTFTSGLSIAMAEPQWAMTDTSDGDKAVAISLIGNAFVIAADRNGDGTVEAPIALLLNSNNNTAQLYGSLAYTRANILGTVGQSGGTPTGAIVERGSNANGEYVRFADGTQICQRINLTITRSATFSIEATWTFPAAFASTPVAFAATSNLGATFSGLSRTDLGAVRTTAGLSSIEIGFAPVTGVSLAPGATVSDIRVCAIGRWF